jgi:hypothetical protein
MVFCSLLFDSILESPIDISFSRLQTIHIYPALALHISHISETNTGGGQFKGLISLVQHAPEEGPYLSASPLES